MSTERDRGLTREELPRPRRPEGGERHRQDPRRTGGLTEEENRERLRRRAIFLRELAEARELRRRVTPRRSRRAQARAAMRQNAFRAL